MPLASCVEVRGGEFDIDDMLLSGLLVVLAAAVAVSIQRSAHVTALAVSRVVSVSGSAARMPAIFSRMAVSRNRSATRGNNLVSLIALRTPIGALG